MNRNKQCLKRTLFNGTRQCNTTIASINLLTTNLNVNHTMSVCYPSPPSDNTIITSINLLETNLNVNHIIKIILSKICILHCLVPLKSVHFTNYNHTTRNTNCEPRESSYSFFGPRSFPGVVGLVVPLYLDPHHPRLVHHVLDSPAILTDHLG